MEYADITLVPVRHDRRDAYLAFSRRMAQVYLDHGALEVVDHWHAEGAADQSEFHAEGTSYEPGELRGWAAVAGTAETETVVVTVTRWPSREIRDRGTAAAVRDPRVLATLDEEPVFDGARLVAGSFAVALTVPERD